MAEGVGSTLSGGRDNRAVGNQSAVSGGRNNVANGKTSTVSGGAGLSADQDDAHLP